MVNIKKIISFIKKNPLNPVLLVFFFSLIGLVLLILNQKEEDSFDIFLTCISLGISAAVVQCALIQNRIQKDNIKIQLFDKRYAIFQTVLDSITIIQRDNWDRYLLFKDDDINKQIIQIEENFYKSVQLSICLFDKELYFKLVKVNNAFCNIVQSYKDILTSNIKNFSSQKDIQDFLGLFNSYLLSHEGLNSDEFNTNLKKQFPETYTTILDFSEKCKEYLSLVEECGIIKDFGRYIIVNELEK